MSPIFVRPVREQLEHDRLIRHLQAHYRKKNNEVAINPGEDQSTSVKLGPSLFFPDIVVSEGGRLTGLVEVESGESVNNLEAMAQWVHFGKARVPFHLYVPVQFYDSAKRLADARGVRITEIWTYRGLLDGFDLVRMHHDPAAGVPKAGVPGVKVTGKPVPIPVPPAEPIVAPEVVPPPVLHAKAPAGKPAAVAAGSTAKATSAAAKPVPAARPEAAVTSKSPVKPVKAAPTKAVAAKTQPAKAPKTTKAAKPAPRPAAKATSKGHKAKATAKPAAKRPKPTPKGAKKAARRK